MCLQCKQLGLAPGGPEDDDGVPAFLAKAMSPPHEKSVSNALELLVELGAMEPETNELTSLGRCLSVLSLEPRVGKMVIYSHLLGCARAAAFMGVAMSYKSPFILPPPSMQRSSDLAKVELSQGSESDQVTIMYAINERDKLFRQNRQGAFKGFCDRNFLGMSTLQMIPESWYRWDFQKLHPSMDITTDMTERKIYLYGKLPLPRVCIRMLHFEVKEKRIFLP
jgi:ATP-dependent RNA helicase YTHDC2